MDKFINNYSIVYFLFTATLVLASCQMPNEPSVPKYKPTEEEVRAFLSYDLEPEAYHDAVQNASSALVKEQLNQLSGQRKSSYSGSGSVDGANWNFEITYTDTTARVKNTITTSKAFPLDNGYFLATGTRIATESFTDVSNPAIVTGYVQTTSSMNFTGGIIETVSKSIRLDLSKEVTTMDPKEIVVNGHVFVYADVVSAP